MKRPTYRPIRVWHEFRAGNATRSYRDVQLTLQTSVTLVASVCLRMLPGLIPAQCSVRMVQRALVQAQVFGLVSWTERRVRAGWRWLRTSNAYRLTLITRAECITSHSKGWVSV